MKTSDTSRDRSNCHHRIHTTLFKLMSNPLTTADLSTTSTNLKALIDGHLEDTGGLLRLSPPGSLAPSCNPACASSKY